MRPATALGFLVLCGCAVDCTDRNWQERGYRDGYGGHPAQDLALERHCGVEMVRADYLRGWEVGHDEHMRLKTMRCD
jgi:hypothetical protein